MRWEHGKIEVAGWCFRRWRWGILQKGTLEKGGRGGAWRSGVGVDVEIVILSDREQNALGLLLGGSEANEIKDQGLCQH